MIQLKEEHKNFTPIELSLLTWYKSDNPLYKDSEHPTIKLAGEIGELLDLYGKHKFKPNFDWMICKNCKCTKEQHFDSLSPYACKNYTPIVLDELGDIWYYLRILAWMNDVELDYEQIKYGDSNPFMAIKYMYFYANNLLQGSFGIKPIIDNISYNLRNLLKQLDYTIEDLTLINYQKLVLDSTNHGWKDAR